MNREQFNKNWSVESIEQPDFNAFKNLTLDIIITDLSFSLFNGPLAKEFLIKSGQGENTLLRQSRGDGCLPMTNNFVKFSVIYKLLKDENDIYNYIFYLQSLLNCDNIETKKKDNLFQKFHKCIIDNSIQAQLLKINDKILLLPKDTKELSQDLIINNIVWLDKYPLAKKAYQSALEKYSKGIFDRNTFDDLRLSLEILLKNILNNSKSLENQKSILGQYLENKGTSIEISNMFWTLLDYYTKYQNKYIKHNSVLNKSELSFMLYLTGTFMNLFTTLEE